MRGDHESAVGSGRRLAGCGLCHESLAPESGPGQVQRPPGRQLAICHPLLWRTRPPVWTLPLAVTSCWGAGRPLQTHPPRDSLPHDSLEPRELQSCTPTSNPIRYPRNGGGKLAGGQGGYWGCLVPPSCDPERMSSSDPLTPVGPGSEESTPHPGPWGGANRIRMADPIPAREEGREALGPQGVGSQELHPTQAHWLSPKPSEGQAGLS